MGPQVMDFLLGRFTGVDHIDPSYSAGELTVPTSSAATSELAGQAVVQRFIERRTTAPFEVLNIFMRDRDSGDVLLYSFDSLGYCPDPPARGTPRDGEIVLHRTSPRGMSRTTFASTETGLRWSKEFRLNSDGPWEPVVTGELRRDSTDVATGIDA